MDTLFSDLAREMMFRSDFAFIPWLDDISIIELECLTASNHAAAAIVDNVQLTTEMTCADGVALSLTKHFDALALLCANDRWHRVLRELLDISGKLARAMALLVVVFAVVTGAGRLNLLPIQFVAMNRRDADLMVILTVTAMVVVLFSFLNLQSFMHSGSSLGARRPQSAAAFYGFGISGAIIGFSTARLDISSYWNVVIGVLFGIALESIVRARRRQEYTRLFFDLVPAHMRYPDYFGDILEQLYENMARSTAQSGRRFVEPLHKRAFINYSRSSPWCGNISTQIADLLRSQGAYVYLDTQSLRPGYSWKHQIRRAIDDVNVFIIVLDEAACHRDWIAAEFVAAYAKKIKTGVPEIFVIHQPELNFAGLQGSYAAKIFSEIIHRPAVAVPERMRFKLAAYSEDKLRDIGTAIRFYPISGTIGFGNPIVNTLVGTIIGFAVSVLLPLRVLGLSLLAIPLLQFFGKFTLGDFLFRHGALVAPIAVSCAVEFGACLRLAVSNFSELKRADPQFEPGYVEVAAGAGFAAVLACCLPMITLRGACVAMLAFYGGIVLADYYSICMRTFRTMDYSREGIAKLRDRLRKG
jgi:hypothetical protein